MAQSVNRVILIGNLGQDPEIKYTPSGQAMAKFSLATNEYRRDAQGNRVEETEWHNIVLWGKNAETAGEYLKKGRTIYLEGRIRTRSWEDSSGGGKKYRTEIQGERFVMLGARSESGEDSDRSRTSAASPTQPEAPSRLEDEEDLPF